MRFLKNRIWLVYLLVAAWLLIECTSQAPPAPPPPVPTWESLRIRTAMQYWAAEAQDPDNRIANWKDPMKPLCTFEGVDCDEEDYTDDRVMYLDLSGFGVEGTFEGWMWTVAEKKVDLSGNTLVGDTTAFEQVRGDGPQEIICVNCGFYHKAPNDGIVLPPELTEIPGLEKLDLSMNRNLIGAISPTWADSGVAINLEGTGICKAEGLDAEKLEAVFGSGGALQECPELDAPPPPPAPPSPPAGFPPVQLGNSSLPANPPRSFRPPPPSCVLPNVRLETSAEVISNANPVVVHALFEDGSGGNPCDLFGCSASAVGIDVDIEKTAEAIDRSTWLLFHNDQGKVTFLVLLEIGNSCEPLLLSTSYVYDSQPPSVQATIYQASTQANTTSVVAFAFSETVRPLNRSAFEHNTLLLKIERMTDLLTVVSMDGSPGHLSRIALLKSSYLDTAGNFGANDAIVEVENPVNLKFANVVRHTKTPVVLMVGGGLAISTVAAPAGAGGFTMRTNLVRASLHLQFLAMTANMAVPGLSEGYKDLAETFSWASFASKDSPWQETEKDDFSGSGRKLESSSLGDGTVVAARPRQTITRAESFDHFLETLIVLGALLSVFVLLHLIVLKVFKGFDKKIPKILTFPRLDVQLVMAANPPLAFSCCRLLSFGDPLAVCVSIAVLLLFVTPFLFWFVWVLTLHNLILAPKIYYSKDETEGQGSLDDVLISPFQGQICDSGSEAKSIVGGSHAAPPPLQTKTPDLVSFLHEKRDKPVKDNNPCAGNDPSSTLDFREAANVERLLSTRPARVDSETGEITKSCPSTRSFPLPMPHSTLRLNPYRSAGRSAAGSPLLTPPHHQRYDPTETEEQVILPGSDISEAVAPQSWMGILPHNARYDDSESDSDHLEEIHEATWRPPQALPPLPPSSSEKYTELFRAQSSKRVRQLPEPIAEGARIQSTDSEGCRAPLLDPKMRERTVTDGLRSTVSLSALDFFSDRDSLIYGRSTSDPALGQNSVRDTNSYLIPECNEECSTSWSLFETQKGFIARYGFAFEDILGTDPENGRFRATPHMLATHAVFFMSRVVAAAAFGFWSRCRRSWIQVIILFVAHLVCVLHLVYVRPYATRSLQFVEGFVHIVESIILVGAMVLLFSIHAEWVNALMIGAFYCGALALGIFEFRRLIPLAKMLGGRPRWGGLRSRKRGEYVRETLE